MINIIDTNESFTRVEFDDFGEEEEFKSFLSFYAPNYKWTPKYKAGVWDGKIYLFNQRTRSMPKGLLKIAMAYFKSRGYEVKVDPSLYWKTGLTDVEEFIDSIQLHTNGTAIKLRDYQREAVLASMAEYRNILISPTACLDPDEEIEVWVQGDPIDNP